MVCTLNARIKFDEVQEVDIADLLGRDAVIPDPSLLSANITNKVVMVTGAGGSIGSELCRQIIALQPAKVILFERNEFALYSIDKELRQAVIVMAVCEFEIIPILGSVIDELRLKKVCRAFNVQTM
jgi:FlaA1/EpsC-like NDP-sugar epimerase